MTTIVFKKKDDSYQGFTCIGHAGYARRGFLRKEPDILCAAISALTFSVLNGLQELGKEKLKVVQNEESGLIDCEFEGILQEKSVFLMDYYALSMENLSRQYGKTYLTVKYEEV